MILRSGLHIMCLVYPFVLFYIHYTCVFPVNLNPTNIHLIVIAVYEYKVTETLPYRSYTCSFFYPQCLRFYVYYFYLGSINFINDSRVQAL